MVSRKRKGRMGGEEGWIGAIGAVFLACLE